MWHFQTNKNCYQLLIIFVIDTLSMIITTFDTVLPLLKGYGGHTGGRCMCSPFSWQSLKWMHFWLADFLFGTNEQKNPTLHQFRKQLAYQMIENKWKKIERGELTIRRKSNRIKTTHSHTLVSALVGAKKYFGNGKWFFYDNKVPTIHLYTTQLQN